MSGHKDTFTPMPGGKFVYVDSAGKSHDAECLGFGDFGAERYPVMLVRFHDSACADVGFVKKTGDAPHSVKIRQFSGRFYDALEEKTWSAMVNIDILTGQPGMTSIAPGTLEHYDRASYLGRLEFVTAGSEIKFVNYIPFKKG